MPPHIRLPVFPGFEQLLTILNAEKVEYVVIGAYAVMIHAQPRAAQDLGILIGSHLNNAEAVWRALAKFGAALQNVTPAALIEPGTFFRMGTPPIMIDILPEMSGVRFSQARPRAPLPPSTTLPDCKRPLFPPPTLSRRSLRPDDLRILPMWTRCVRRAETNLRNQPRTCPASSRFSQEGR
jgi:hypothetical protein